MQQHETIPLIAVKRGHGAWLYDADNRRYLDAISSWWVNLFGHTNARINQALKDQLDTLEHAMLAGFTHEPVVELSEKLAAMTNNVLGHCFFASDGASAIEIALKMSFQSWRNQNLPKKQEFIYIKGGYHGETLGALSVTDIPIFRDVFAALLKPAHCITSPDSRLALVGETSEDQALRAAHALEILLQEKSTYISAVVVEPLVQCAGGMAMHSPLYLQEVRKLCDRFNIHMIADEIAVGCGRTGTFFACEQASIWPDFLCLSKGISGGYLPLSLVMTREDIFQTFYSDRISQGFLHSHSYTGNPLACRAALATLSIFETDDVLANNKKMGQRLTQALKPIIDHKNIAHFRHQGMIWAFDAQVSDKNMAATFSRRFFTAALKQELLLRPIGNTVYLMPPYILSDNEIELLAQRLFVVFEQVIRT